MNPFNYKTIESSLLMDSEGKILDANPPAVEMIGLSKEEILGRSCYEVIEGRDPAGNLLCFEGCAVMKMARRKEPVNNYEMQMTTHDGRKQRLNVSTLVESGSGVNAHPKIVHIFRPAASLIQIAGTAEDITERKRLETVLQESETRFSGIINIAPEAIITTDNAHKILSFNTGAEKIFGYDAAEVIGRPLDLLIPQRFAEKHPQYIRDFGAAGGPSRIMANERPEIIGLRKDGTEFPAEVSISKWETGNQTLYAAILRDVTERKRSEATIRRLAYYDSLTDLPNRTFFKDILKESILHSQYEERPLAVLLIDLDHFKEINDTLGHHRGDFLLQQVGMRLKDALKPDDTISRLGGDEFGVVLPLAASEDAGRVADKVMKKLDEPFIIEGLPIAVELSMGIALYPDHGESAESLMQRADVALYVAKKSGRGHILYAPEHDRHSPRRLALLGELKRAIETSQVYLEYQPKITLSTGRMVGLEALARWKHPDLGSVPPDEFIPPAEQTGLIKPLTAFILNQALRQLCDWRKIDPAITIAVNLSVRNLLDPKLPDQISEMLQAHGIPPDGLVLEITESGIMTDAQAALSTISLLVGRGIHCSIDDFGIGQSSLSYLKKLPVSSIKIDQAFVTHMATDLDDEMIVRSTIDLAHHLGRRVIAEGVEDSAAFKRLVELDCDEAQGFYISNPIPAAEIAPWLNRSFR